MNATPGLGAKNVVRVLLADDDDQLRQDFASLLEAEPEIELVAAVSDGIQALKLLERGVWVHVALLDIAMPGMDGVETAQHISRRFPRVKAVILTAFADEGSFAPALEAGVSGFLTKDVALEELVGTIKRAAAGEIVMGARPTQLLAEQFVAGLALRSSPEAQAFRRAVRNLKPRYHAVYAGFVAGLPNRQIADELGVKESTIQSYTTPVLRELGCTSRAEVAAKAARFGCVDVEGL